MRRPGIRSTISIVIIGSVIFLLILVIGTILSGFLTTKDTEKAVESVSVLYLDELAGRREQVVSANLNRKIEDMSVAIELMDGSDLSDIEHLQAYQARMKRIYKLEKFAFVDDAGLIYTSL